MGNLLHWDHLSLYICFLPKHSLKFNLSSHGTHLLLQNLLLFKEHQLLKNRLQLSHGTHLSHRICFANETYSLKKVNLNSHRTQNLYNVFSGDLSKDKLSKFQVILYPELTLDMKPFLFQQYVSFVIELITHRFFNTRNKLEAYIPTLFNPITQQARRLHAADL